MFCRFKLPNENADVPSVQKMHKIAAKNIILGDLAIVIIGVISREWAWRIIVLTNDIYEQFFNDSEERKIDRLLPTQLAPSRGERKPSSWRQEREEHEWISVLWEPLK